MEKPSEANMLTTVPASLAMAASISGLAELPDRIPDADIDSSRLLHQ